MHTPRCRSLAGVGCLLLQLIFQIHTIAAELVPSESSLPEDVFLDAIETPDNLPLPRPKTNDLQQWPPESELPLTMALPEESVLDLLDGKSTVDKEATSPDLDRPPIEKLAVDLPSEGDLPLTMVGDQPAAPPEDSPSDAPVEAADETTSAVELAANSPLQLERSLDNLPWLRLNLPGHVGQIRALTFTADGRRLCVAGDDKALLMWTRAEDASWYFERAVRWQVQRSTRGQLSALAASPGLVAMGGLGAMGQMGEVLLIDPDRGTLRAALDDQQQGHQTRITGLAFQPRANPAESRLASIDVHGRLLLWTPQAETGLWQARQLAFDVDQAEALSAFRAIHPIAMLGDRHVVAPLYAGRDDKQRVRWQLQQIDTETGASRKLSMPDEYHYFFVTALVASASGARFVSADEAGQLFVWSVDDKIRRTVLRKSGSTIMSLAISRDGSTIAFGTRVSASQPQGSLEVWDIKNPSAARPIAQIPTDGTVTACAIGADDQILATSQGATVTLRSLREPQKIVQTLSSPLESPVAVAFRKQPGNYDVAIRTRRAAGAKATEGVRIFDTSRLQWDTATKHDDAEWRSDGVAPGDWAIRPRTGQAINDYELTRGGQPVAVLPVRKETQGAITATCWIPNEAGQPIAVALATSGMNDICVVTLGDQAHCRLVRVFRGHEGAVNSLSLSADRRYLASASQDGTVRFWKWEDATQQTDLINRWGAEFVIENGTLVAQGVVEDGPIYFRGIRSGDVVQRIRLPEYVQGRVKVEEVTEVQAMLTALKQREAHKLVGFDCVRGSAKLRSFQLHPAWQPLASLLATPDREWAFWSAAGYYDASFEGHKLFGWQVNRGLDRLPDFFLAAQVRQTLERPEVMSQLLRAGSLDKAFQQNRAELPANWSHVVAIQNRLRPSLDIVSPRAGEPVSEGRTVIRARIQVPHGNRLREPKAFANGVIATGRTLVQQTSGTPYDTYEYQWEASLPTDRRVLIQVIAGTDARVIEQQQVLIEQTARRLPRRPRLYIVGAGVNAYRDSRLPRLEFAVNNAQQFVETLRAGSQSIYESRAVSLANERVTRPVWNVTLQRYATELRTTVQPDDLLVIYLSGHGVRDPLAGGYYYVTADANYQDLRAGQFAECLSFEDFSQFADIPCRKLVILDTCHSGAIQPLDQRELKSALRALQDDVFLTLSATEGGQEAVEDRTKRFGRFTYRLLEGLRGRADAAPGNQDGRVNLSELTRYVQRTVAADSARDIVGQFPTAGPHDLLQVVDVPLTTVSKQAAATASRRSATNRPLQVVRTSTTAGRSP